MKNHFSLLEKAMTNEPAFDGQNAQIIHLHNANGMSVSFMDIGATWLSCVLPVNGNSREVLLQAKNMTEHKKQGAYLGAIVGRFANRICQGQFQIDGKQFTLEINNGENALHGGITGFDKKRWLIAAKSKQQVEFTLHSPDGDQNYPGNVNVKVIYTLTDNNALTIEYQAQTDKACPVNLTNHAYFNLAGEHCEYNALQHVLKINAPYYLPTNTTAIPTGELKSVTGTSFDFTQAKTIGQDFLTQEDQKMLSGYDHCFVFDEKVIEQNLDAAILIAPKEDVILKIKTSKPGIQFYSGNFLAGTIGKTKTYANQDGIALETQYFPDAPNQTQWQNNSKINNAILLPQQTYQHTTTYQFEF